jgi:hypothetical protein
LPWLVLVIGWVPYLVGCGLLVANYKGSSPGLSSRFFFLAMGSFGMMLISLTMLSDRAPGIANVGTMLVGISVGIGMAGILGSYAAALYEGTVFMKARSSHGGGAASEGCPG